MKTGKATMGDVAARAGVSAATVARVLYKSGYVKSETRAAVEAAVQSTGYRPNVVARGLRTNRSFIIGLVMCEDRMSSIPAAVVHAVQTQALEHGYAVFAFNSVGDSVLEEKGVQRFLDHHVDAVIFYGPQDARNVRAIVEHGLPAVQLERVVLEGSPSIAVSPVRGMDQAISRLHELGHRRIAYIGGEVGSKYQDVAGHGGVEGWREAAFVAALATRGLEARPEWLLRCPYSSPGAATQPAHDMMRNLLALPLPPTAVICGSDVMAASAMQAIFGAGLQVPRDISVVGFDDSVAEILSPPASTISQPVAELGELAVQMVIAALNDPETAARQACVDTQFIERASTGPAPLS